MSRIKKKKRKVGNRKKNAKNVGVASGEGGKESIGGIDLCI